MKSQNKRKSINFLTVPHGYVNFRKKRLGTMKQSQIFISKLFTFDLQGVNNRTAPSET